jgi:voltage-gated potassium channel
MKTQPPHVEIPSLESEVERERNELLERVTGWLEMPLLLLGLVWLGLIVIELIGKLTPPLERLGGAIYVVFALDFAFKFWLAPRKTAYLRANWLTLFSLLLPALRVFRFARLLRILRAARTTRGLRLVRVFSGLNRGMKALGQTMGRRGFGYVVALTLLVTMVGAAGMFAFEGEVNHIGFGDYATSLWWTAMLMTTLGSEAWPQTAEGRVLSFGLALYAFAVFGYVTATLATFFVGRDAQNPEAEVIGSEDLVALREEITALREELRRAREEVNDENENE